MHIIRLPDTPALKVSQEYVLSGRRLCYTSLANTVAGVKITPVLLILRMTKSHKAPEAF
jgi:hypothetical protein